MIRKSTPKTNIYLFEKLAEYGNLKHFISTNILKKDISYTHDLDISFNGGLSYNEIIRNRRILAEAADIPISSFVMQEQIHGNTVKVVCQKDKGKGVMNQKNALQESDAMITDEKWICLFLFAADCVPILLFDPVNKVIGAAHAGWKGTVLKIAEKTVNKMNSEYGSEPSKILACLGPSISVNNFEIGENVIEEVMISFGTKEGFLKYNQSTEKYHMDLWYSNKRILTDSGLQDENIQIAGICTYDNTDKFYSARKKNSGRFAAGIMLC